MNQTKRVEGERIRFGADLLSCHLWWVLSSFTWVKVVNAVSKVLSLNSQAIAINALGCFVCNWATAEWMVLDAEVGLVHRGRYSQH